MTFSTYLPALALALSALQPVLAQRPAEGVTFIQIRQSEPCLSPTCQSEIATNKEPDDTSLGPATVCKPNWCASAECGNWGGMKNTCCSYYKHSTEKGRGAQGPNSCNDIKEFAESASAKDGIEATAEFCKKGGWPLYGAGDLVCCPDNYHALVIATENKGFKDIKFVKRCVASTDVSKKNDKPEPVLTGTPITTGLAEATGSSSSGSGSGSGSGTSDATPTGSAASSTSTSASGKSAGSSTYAVNAVAVLGFSLVAAIGWLQFL